jgi:hypothetical protein
MTFEPPFANDKASSFQIVATALLERGMIILEQIVPNYGGLVCSHDGTVLCGRLRLRKV